MRSTTRLGANRLLATAIPARLGRLRNAAASGRIGSTSTGLTLRRRWIISGMARGRSLLQTFQPRFYPVFNPVLPLFKVSVKDKRGMISSMDEDEWNTMHSLGVFTLSPAVFTSIDAVFTPINAVVGDEKEASSGDPRPVNPKSILTRLSPI